MEVIKHGNNWNFALLRGVCERCGCEFICHKTEATPADHDPDAVAYGKCPECHTPVDLQHYRSK